MLTFDAPISPSGRSKYLQGSNLGLRVFHESYAVTRQFAVQGMYAYRLPISNNTYLALGLQLGIRGFTHKLSDLNPVQAGDNVLAANISNQIMPSAGVGIYLHNPSYFLGLSNLQLLESNPNSNSTSKNSSLQHLYVIGGYKISLSSSLTLQPSFLVKAAGWNDALTDNAVQFDANLALIVRQRWLVGLNLRVNESIAAIAEFQITNQLRLGYSYDYNTTTLSSSNSGSHEVNLGWDLSSGKTKAINPRFINGFEK